jgi:spore cortex formation protein SpoVR/YcgB (stage V sporulation)
MSTRAQVRFATREDGVSFSEHPEKIHAQFYVHSDGYPEGLGLQIAESLTKCNKITGWEIEFLYQKHGDLEYIYYIWQNHDDETWISIFEDSSFPGYCERCEQLLPSRLGKCIFVGKPEKLIKKYKLNTNKNG